MEFPFNINSIFPNDITLIDSRLTTGDNGSNEIRRNKDQLISVINQMGIASSKAQGLNSVITSTSRLAVSAHHLYVLKDADVNNGQGAVVGILRVGHKKLFVYDQEGSNHELEPLCVLDFYVHESRQRTGCGKKLFDFMLQTEQRQPVDFAVDRPSPKFLAFLAKHYKLRAVIPQVNNFVIFEGFFTKNSRSNRTREINRSSHGSGWGPQEVNFINEKDALSHVTLPTSNGQLRSAGNLNDTTGQWSSNLMHDQKPPSAMGAQRSQYSRHMSSVSPVLGKPRDIKEINVDAAKVCSPPLLRRRNGPSDEFTQLTHGRINQTPAMSVEDSRKTNISQDTAPQTTTDTNVLQANDRRPSAVPSMWSQRNVEPAWKKLALDQPPAIGRYASSRKYYNHTRLW